MTDIPTLPSQLRKAAVPAVVALVLAIGALAFVAWLAHHDDQVVENHENKVGLELEQSARTADQQLAERRQALEQQQADDRKEFNNATAHLPASGLSDRQRLDACQQLRRQGEPAAILARAGCV